MTDLQIGLIGVVILLLLLFAGMRIAYAISFVGVFGVIIVKGWGPSIALIGSIPSDVVAVYTYSAIPLFVLMGYFAYYAGITDSLFETAKAWVQHIRGGLPAATILAGAGFATVSGASTAATNVLGRIAIPQMLKNGVHPRLATGTVAMSGCLAALIPPSTIMIVYGALTEQSIAYMLIAGIVPGVLTVISYLLLIYVRSSINPNLAPTAERLPLLQRIKSLKNTFGMLTLVALVMGGIYLGFFTPTEAAGVGAFGAFLLAIRKMNFEKLKSALLETCKVSAMIFAIMVGVSFFSRFLAYTGVTKVMKNFVLSLSIPSISIILVMLLIYLILGMFMDGVSMMMLTLPIFFPIVMELGYHPIWFGIIVVKMAEIGLVTPPVGLNCFMVKSVAPKIPLGTIFRGVMPFIIIDIVVVILLLLFPDIVTFLPELMK